MRNIHTHTVCIFYSNFVEILNFFFHFKPNHAVFSEIIWMMMMMICTDLIRSSGYVQSINWWTEMNIKKHNEWMNEWIDCIINQSIKNKNRKKSQTMAGFLIVKRVNDYIANNIIITIAPKKEINHFLAWLKKRPIWIVSNYCICLIYTWIGKNNLLTIISTISSSLFYISNLSKKEILDKQTNKWSKYWRHFFVTIMV